MTTTPAYLAQGQLANAAGTLVTAATSGQTLITLATFTNVDTVPHTITIGRYASGGAAGTTKVIISAFRLTPGQCYVSPEIAGLVLSNGDVLYGLADTGAEVNYSICGYTF